MLFLYGTLLDPRLFARSAGCALPRRAVAATLHHHRRVTLRGTRYPTVVPGEGAVAGVLLPRLAPAAPARLAAYEGAGYALAPVRVATPRGARRARAWIAPRWRADPRLFRAPRANVTNLGATRALRFRPVGVAA